MNHLGKCRLKFILRKIKGFDACFHGDLSNPECFFFFSFAQLLLQSSDLVTDRGRGFGAGHVFSPFRH
ncbi:hypothetical protein AZF01_23230 (plasmid) [Martelella sp. AD-3]|nr:hypothetical protein AZF01_23230 [Martelella sp. AD-3]